jgi:hypothetical protein
LLKLAHRISPLKGSQDKDTRAKFLCQSNGDITKIRV